MSEPNQLQNAIRSIADALSPAALDAAGRPRFSFNQLATPPLRPTKRLLGLFSLIEAPPATWAIYYGNGSAPAVLSPGAHWLNSMNGGAFQVQLVDASRRQHPLPPLSALTRDGWRVTLRVALIYEVVDPIQIARAATPLDALEAAGRAAVLAQIAAMIHEELLGLAADDGLDRHLAESGEKKQSNSIRNTQTVEERLLAHLSQRPSLAGLRVIEVVIVDRQGDERLAEIMQAAVVERAQVMEECQTEAERAELARVRLETEAQVAAEAARASLLELFGNPQQPPSGRADVVGEGLKVLQGYREKIPPLLGPDEPAEEEE